MDDVISRKAAIDADGLDEEIRCEMCKNPMHTDRGCDGNCKYDEILYEKIIQILNKRITQLTFAQPDVPDTNVGDTISRQNAIDEIRKCRFVVDAIEKIRALPSAPQRTGRWIDHAEEGYVECPFCQSATNCDGNISELHFCFSCGARMDVE